jgi:hypothetical protein
MAAIEKAAEVYPNGIARGAVKEVA